jgi:hypothetical protein
VYLTLCLRSRGHLTCGNCYGILNGVLFADGKCVAMTMIARCPLANRTILIFYSLSLRFKTINHFLVFLNAWLLRFARGHRAIIEDYKVSVTSGDEYSDPRYLL